MKLMTIPSPSFRDASKTRTRNLEVPGSMLRIAPERRFESVRSSSIRLRQAEHLLGDEAENELRADRRDARDQGFPQIALDVIFLGVAEAAMRHDGLFAGVEAGLRSEIFGGIGGRAAWHALVVLPARAQHHHPRGFQLHPVPGQRMLDALIHADRTVEH